MTRNNNKYILTILLTAILWFLMFSKWTAPLFNFWIAMSISATILWCISFLLNKNFIKSLKIKGSDILIGIGSAALLWLIFLAGDYFSNLLFSFEKSQVSSIYSMKDGHNAILISMLLLLIIGPAEEVFWRGTIQKHFMKYMGEWYGIIFTSIIYAAVHIWSFNFMLIMAALVCGLFWGLLYKYTLRLPAIIISHALWDVAVFIWFPII